MCVTINLYSNKENEIGRFLNSFYDNNINIENNCLKWEHCFENPIESTGIIGAFIDNNDKFKFNMWVSLDKGFFINVTDFNSDKLIRYIFERYPN